MSEDVSSTTTAVPQGTTAPPATTTAAPPPPTTTTAPPSTTTTAPPPTTTTTGHTTTAPPHTTTAPVPTTRRVPPKVESFTVAAVENENFVHLPDTLELEAGAQAKLSWTVSNAEAVELTDPRSGAKTIRDGSTSLVVTPAAASNDYLLVALSGVSRSGAVKVHIGTHPSDQVVSQHATVSPPTGEATVLTADEKVQIVRRIAKMESGSDPYGACNLDSEFEGRFDQPSRWWHDTKKRKKTARPDAKQPSVPYSKYWDAPRHVKRRPSVVAVAGAEVWSSEWVSRFKQAGAYEPFQRCQIELAIDAYMTPFLQAATKAKTKLAEKTVYRLYDRSVNQGIGKAKKLLADLKAATDQKKFWTDYLAGLKKDDALVRDRLQGIADETETSWTKLYTG
jgi:hypothetical protein